MKITNSIGTYFRDIKGNFSILFAISLTVLVLMAGAAIDISSLLQSKTRYQDIADSAVLSAVRSGETNPGTLSQIAKAIAKTQFGENFTQDIKTRLEIDGREVKVSITGKHKYFFMGIFGKKQAPILVEAVSIIPGQNKKNIAFVLDTTQSMEGEKIETLQTAMLEFVESMEPALAANNAMVSIIPFADYVRIPLKYGGANWIEVQPAQEISYNVLDGVNSVNCRTEGTGEGQYTVCDSYVYIEETTVTEWKGCMGSRPDNFHKVPDYKNKVLPGFNGSRATCYDAFAFLQPLTTDLAVLEQGIKNLTPRGFTYIPSGLIWGWRTLSPNEPFVESFGSDGETENLLVLMTDGANSMSLDDTVYDGTLYHWGQASSSEEGYEAINAATANPLTLELCDSIKADNIEIVTVAYEVSDPDTLDILQKCASSTSEFYNAQNSDQLIQAFKDISAGQDEIRLIR